MRACVLTDVGRLDVRETPAPAIGPYDVLVRVSAVGLCGTDFHIFGGHANYHYDSQGRQIPLTVDPQILGHEIAGIVEEAGSEVPDLQIGTRVVLDQGLNCLSARRQPLCEYCSSSDSHQCEFYGEHGITGLPGGLADLIAMPAVNAIRLDSDLELSEAALTEPLGCIVHSCDAAQRAGGRYRINHELVDSRVRALLICGAGPAGLLFTQYLRNVLGYEGLLIVAEPNPLKRALAARFGASVIDPGHDDLVEAVHQMTGGRRVEYLVEAAGAGALFAQIPGLIRKQGTLLLYGHGHSGVDLGVLNNIQFLEPTLVAPVGASGGHDDDGRPSTYRRALELIEEGTIRVAPFITHRYNSLDSVPDAFAGQHREPDYVKGVVMLGEDRR
jgi:L-iditol 2-dehydrogenase